MIEDKIMNREDIRLQRQTMETLEFKLLVEDGRSNLTQSELVLISRYLLDISTELNCIEKIRYLLSNWGIENTLQYLCGSPIKLGEPSYNYTPSILFARIFDDNKRSILELIDATRENK